MCDYDLIGGGDPIGKIMLGWTQNKSYKPGFKHWKEALENPRRPIIKWHVLQVSDLDLPQHLTVMWGFHKKLLGNLSQGDQ